MVVQAFRSHRALSRGGVSPCGIPLCGCAAGLHPRQLAREREGRETPAFVPGEQVPMILL